MAVTPTKSEIKTWLKTRGHSREWLGGKCGGTSKNTVNNWLSTSIEIPAGQLEIIRRLMADDAQHMEANADPKSHIVIRVPVDEFQQWEQAALLKGKTITDYCVLAIREAYQAEKTDSKTLALPAFTGLQPLEAPSKVADGPTPLSSLSIPANTAPKKYPVGKRSKKSGTK